MKTALCVMLPALNSLTTSPSEFTASASLPCKPTQEIFVMIFASYEVLLHGPEVTW